MSSQNEEHNIISMEKMRAILKQHIEYIKTDPGESSGFYQRVCEVCFRIGEFDMFSSCDDCYTGSVPVCYCFNNERNCGDLSYNDYKGVNECKRHKSNKNVNCVGCTCNDS